MNDRVKEAYLRQFLYWDRALRQVQKAVRRRNKYINRLVRENQKLKSENAALMIEIAKFELS